MFHGMGSHTGMYGHLAKRFVDHRIEVCGYDYMGYGQSEGVRGHIPS